MGKKSHIIILFIYHFVIRFDEIKLSTSLSLRNVSVVLRGILKCE